MIGLPQGFAFDEAYYRNGFGPEPYERNAHWMAFFRHLADKIIATEKPRSVLDAGCAMGMLVEALRDREVDARGIDVSRYAVSRARPDIQPYCRVSSIADPVEGQYDLATCIEVVEHMPADEALQALQNLTAATDKILFSSTPDRDDEPTHINIRPIREWLHMFSDLGFEPDIAYDASFLCAHAFLVRRTSTRLAENVKDLFAQNLMLRMQLHRNPAEQIAKPAAPTSNGYATEALAPGGSQTALEGSADLSAAEQVSLYDELRLVNNQVAMLQAHSDSILHSPGWSLISRYRNWLHSSVWPNEQIRRVYEPFAAWLLGMVTRKSRAPDAAGSSRTRHVRSDGGLEAIVAEPMANSQDISLCWDGPSSNQRVRDLIEIYGWAAAESGIEKVEVTIDGKTALPVEHAVARLDALKHVPHLPRTLRPGFRCLWDTTLVTPGVHCVRVTATSRNGSSSSLERQFLVDQRDEYDVWQLLHEPTHAERQRMRREITGLSHQPKISLLTPVYQSDISHLALCVSSVTSQIYSNWELCLVDDGSNDPRLTSYLNSLAEADQRIKVSTQPRNRGIAEATNTALEMATGDFVAFLDHDDEIADFALFEVVKALNAEPGLDLLYSDEDKLDERGVRCFPFFKPAWSPDYLRSCNYVCHFFVCRRQVLEDAGRLRPQFDGSQDYELILRLIERTSKIRHVPKILYHWRVSERSAAGGPEAKPEASQAGARALSEHLRRRDINGEVIEIGPSRYRVRYQIQRQQPVDVIIPTGGNIPKLKEALSTVVAKTTYDHYRIFVVDNSSDARVEKFLKTFDSGHVALERLNRRGQPFNFSKLCNEGVAQTNAPYLLFLNDDVSVISTEWLEALVEHAQRPEVGAVGARLRYPDGKIQHAGIVMGLFGNCGQAFRGLVDEESYMDMQGVTRNVSAVTGACLMLRRDVFNEIGRFDEDNLPLAFQDVDLCLRLGEKGYQIVYTPYAELYHHESASKSDSEKIANLSEMEYMQTRWAHHIANDPYYNPNLTRQTEYFGLRLDMA